MDGWKTHHITSDLMRFYSRVVNEMRDILRDRHPRLNGQSLNTYTTLVFSSREPFANILAGITKRLMRVLLILLGEIDNFINFFLTPTVC